MEGVATGEGCIGYSLRFGGAMLLTDEVKRAVVGLDGDRVPMVIVVVSVSESKTRRKGRRRGMAVP